MNEFFSKYNINDQVIAVGVSGGADSLALVYMLQEWAKEYNRKIVALTVDHGLRKESRMEALYVAELMAKWGIEHYILNWEGKKPTTGIEMAARLARYKLIDDWCKENQVSVLAMGHHLGDQAETFLLRLQRGSGLYGLSGILPVSSRNGLTIIRPNLDKNPQDLRQFLMEKNIKWMEDSSNQVDDFQRVKIRKFMPILKKEIAISMERLAETAEVLARTRSYMEEETDKIINNHVRWWEGAIASISWAAFSSLHSEMQYRVLAVLIKDVGRKIYTPEAEDVLRLCTMIVAEGFKGCTLGNCDIFINSGKIWIVPEWKQKKQVSKIQWAEFLEANPQYAKLKIPYKVRWALYSALAK